jgi:protein gp37
VANAALAIVEPDGVVHGRAALNKRIGPIESDEYCWRADVLRTVPAAVRFLSCEPLLGPLPSLNLASIDWLIVGGESGAKFRPLDLDWVRDLRDRRGETAVFFKQVGGRTPKAGGRLLDGRTWDEYPSVSTEVAYA